MKERAGMPYDVVAYEADEIARTLNETEEGLFHRMMRLAWMNGSIPADPAKLAPLLRTRASVLKKAWPKLSQLWVPSRENSERLQNKKQESERDFVEKKRVKAETSANLRWKNKKAKEVGDANALRTECDGIASPPLPVPPLPNKEEKKGKEKRGGVRRAATPAPDTFEVTENLRAWALRINVALDLREETDAMLDYHRSRGNTFANWDATWRTWIRRTAKYTKGINGNSNHAPKDSGRSSGTSLTPLPYVPKARL